MARNVQGPDWPTPNEALRERMPARLQLKRLCRGFVHQRARGSDDEAPVVTMPPRQCLPRARAEILRSGPWGDVAVAGEGRARIYVMPLAVPPTPVSYPAHQAGCELLERNLESCPGILVSPSGPISRFRPSLCVPQRACQRVCKWRCCCSCPRYP